MKAGPGGGGAMPLTSKTEAWLRRLPPDACFSSRLPGAPGNGGHECKVEPIRSRAMRRLSDGQTSTCASPFDRGATRGLSGWEAGSTHGGGGQNARWNGVMWGLCRSSYGQATENKEIRISMIPLTVFRECRETQITTQIAKSEVNARTKLTPSTIFLLHSRGERRGPGAGPRRWDSGHSMAE